MIAEILVYLLCLIILIALFITGPWYIVVVSAIVGLPITMLVFKEKK